MTMSPLPLPLPLPTFSILPLQEGDHLPIANLERLVFSTDPITVYAFGPNRNSPAAMHKRAHHLANPPTDCVIRMRKAVSADASGRIVGFAYWKFHLDPHNDEAGKDSKAPNGDVIGDGKEEKEGGEGKGTVTSTPWPEGANVELCEAVFVKADKLRERLLKGSPHAVLNILVVDSEFRGRGIGRALIEDGLREADRYGLPVWLGATEVALPLYRKVGFVVDTVLEFDMSRYGGEGVEKHISMLRPAKGAVEAH